MTSVYLAFVLIASAAAQGPVFQNCPNIPVKSDFDINKFAGKWYEIERYPDVIGGKCTAVTYSIANSGAISVVLNQVPIRAGQPSTLDGIVTQPDAEKAKLTIAIPSRNDVSPYWIVETDYTSFTVMWSCKNGVPSRAWILARELQPAQSVLDKANAALDKSGIDRSILVNIDRQNCPAGI